MIAFGCSMTVPDVYRACAGRGIARAAEPDSVTFPNAAAGSIFQSYNLILDSAAALPDLEALVLVHQDAEIVDPDLCSKVRRVLADDEVGVAGALGVVGARSIAWWEGTLTWSSVTYRYGQWGGGEISAAEWWRDAVATEPRTGEVDMVVGSLLVLSPWVVRNVRFDESLGAVHGYDFDFCLQVRETGRKVVAEDLPIVHHHSLDLFTKNEPWLAAHARLAEKWEGRMPNVGRPNWGSADDDWKGRARQAEAEAGAARLDRQSTLLRAEATERRLQRELDEMRGSTSWRVTKPLRELNLRLRARRNGTSSR